MGIYFQRRFWCTLLLLRRKHVLDIFVERAGSLFQNLNKHFYVRRLVWGMILEKIHPYFLVYV